MFNSRPWSQEDTKILLRQVADKKKLEEIAKLQKRTVTSIQSKLKTIAANMYLNEQLPYDEIEGRTGIKKDALIVKRNPKNTMELNGSPKEDCLATEPLVSEQHLATQPLATQPLATQPLATQPLATITISTENPFNINTLSSLMILSIVKCLSTNNC